jgi:hypothetical protein
VRLLLLCLAQLLQALQHLRGQHVSRWLLLLRGLLLWLLLLLLVLLLLVCLISWPPAARALLPWRRRGTPRLGGSGGR